MIQGHVLFSFRCRGGIAGDRAGEMKSEGGAVLAVDRRVGAGLHFVNRNGFRSEELALDPFLYG